MEGNNLIKKGVVVSVILLFISVSVIPSTGNRVFFDDTTPPVTTCTLNPPEPNGNNSWYVSDVEVTMISYNPSLFKLQAFPYPGWSFSHWDGDINATGNPINILIEPDMHIIAVFESGAGEPVIKIERHSFPPFPSLVYITNIGDANATDIEWNFKWYGGWILFERFNDNARIDTGEIAVLSPGDAQSISSTKFGFGRVAIIISAECAEGSSDKIVIEAIMMGFFLIIPPR